MKAIAAITCLAALAQAESILPQLPEKSRYAETVGKSPFVLETKAVEEKVVETVNPFKDLYLRAISKVDNKDCVLVQRLGEEKPMRLISGESGDDGLSLKTVRVGNSFRETKVVLQKGPEIGEIGFKEEAISAPPAAPQARPNPGMPPGFIRPGMPVPTKPTTSSTRIVPPPTPSIPRPQFPTAVPLPNTSTQPSTSGYDANRRQRVRVINN
jgi:hypothetical protein